MNLKSYDKIFENDLGEKLYEEALRAVHDFSMAELIEKGTLVGFSGGSDSLFLLLFLTEYRRRQKKDFQILAVHINHCIRGEEADRDEKFSESVANELGIEFLSVKKDIPTIAKKNAKGIEETARDARYLSFDEIIASRNDIEAVATAHNAGDNFETVLFNMMRGTGLSGMCGISPVRGNIVRPLIYISKKEIEEFFKSQNIDFVIDSTNFSTLYTRNYIRHELIPKFERLSDSPERAVKRLCENLRCDNSFIEAEAESFFRDNFQNGKIKTDKLKALHPSLIKRVMAKMAIAAGVPYPEAIHLNNLTRLLPNGDFKLALPGGVYFVSERGECFISENIRAEEFVSELSLGLNEIPGFSDLILISNEKNDNISSNVYKISIQVKLRFDIINKVLYVRSKKDGDSYRFGGISHKLKKLFNDRKIPVSKRSQIPVFASDSGIVWAAGFSPADEADDVPYIYISILESKFENLNLRKFYIPPRN